ncbi:MAG TPA: TraR/DksA C4-type zinc finger protein [Pyrinomonadaceae bacterium]|nr:TraR/DksA C4-type zinc finger protein [Pyrinomonadaceae bacterium]
MNTNPKIHLIEVPVGANGGLVWNRLHSEREDICEAMLKDSQNEMKAQVGTDKRPDDMSTTNWRRELLQARLGKVDDALDRLMSGSYGNCSKCGKRIEDTKLEFDPAIAWCLACWNQESDLWIEDGLLSGVKRVELETTDGRDQGLEIENRDGAITIMRFES